MADQTVKFKLLNKTGEQPKRVEIKTGEKFTVGLPTNSNNTDNSVNVDPDTGAGGFCIGEVICDCEEGYVFIDQEAHYESEIVSLKIGGINIPVSDDTSMLGQLVRGYFTGIVDMVSPVTEPDLFDAVNKIRPGRINKDYNNLVNALVNQTAEPVSLFIAVKGSGGVPLTLIDTVLCPIDCDLEAEMTLNLPDIPVSPNLFLEINGVTISKPDVHEVYPLKAWYEAFNDLIFAHFDNDAPVEAFESDGSRGTIESLATGCTEVHFYTKDGDEIIDHIPKMKLGFVYHIPMSPPVGST